MSANRVSVGRWASDGLALLLPLSVYWPIAASAAPGVAAIYARPSLYLTDVAVAVLLLAYLGAGCPFRAVRRPRRMTGLLVALVALGALTAPAALSPGLAAYTVLRWFLALGVTMALACGNVSTEEWVTVFAIGLGLQACLGIGQVLRQGPLGLPGEATLESHQWGAAVLTVSGKPWLRAYGMTFHPNVLGGCMAVGLLVSLPLLEREWVRPVWWLMGIGLLLSFSRSAWLAVGLILPLLVGWLAWRRPTLRRSLAVTVGSAGLILAVAAGALAGQLVSRLRPAMTASESRSLRERGELIDLALDVVAERPLTGVGAGNFPLAAQRAGETVSPQPVHNVPLLLASEVGLLGGGLWFWLWLTPGLAASERLRDGPTWPVVLAAAWFAWGVIGLWDGYPWVLNSGRVLGASLMGLMGQAWGKDDSG